MTHRVVITGMGVVSPLGHSTEESWQNARQGVSGIDYVTLYDRDAIDVTIVGEVKDFDPVALFGAREARRMDRVQHFALFAAQQALDDSGLSVTEANQYDIGCVMGTGIGGISSVQEALEGYLNQGQRGVSPLVGLREIV